MNITEKLHSAEMASTALSAMGLPVIGVTINAHKVIIRVKYCRQCDRLIRDGRAHYLCWGTRSTGNYKQGYFYINRIRVVWSELTH